MEENEKPISSVFTLKPPPFYHNCTTESIRPFTSNYRYDNDVGEHKFDDVGCRGGSYSTLGRVLRDGDAIGHILPHGEAPGMAQYRRGGRGGGGQLLSSRPGKVGDGMFWGDTSLPSTVTVQVQADK